MNKSRVNVRVKRRMPTTALILAGIAFSSIEPAPGQESEPATNDAFVAWAGANLREVSLTSRTQWSDLEPLRQMIGNASLVSLGEGLHGSAEPLEFRNRLFQFLVEQMGFTAIALESGITESYAINDYVLGGSGDAAEVTARGITFGLGSYPQQLALVRWMREYNLAPRHIRKVQFYGMDISGFSGERAAPLDIALTYLERVDAPAASALRERIAPMRAKLQVDRFADTPNQYSQLAPAQRDAATAVVADMIMLFETREAAYIRASSDRDYELAYRAAIGARQVDDYLRQVPVGWTAKSGPQSIVGTVAVSDRAKLDNIEWIAKQQGANGKVLVFTHLGHAAPTPVIVRLSETDVIPLPPLVGIYLKRRWGPQLATIGHLFSLDTSDCKEERPPAAASSLEGLMASLQKPAFLLDLRVAPAAIRRRLEPMHDLYGQRPVHSLRLDEGVDIVLFTEKVTRATPCP